MAYGISAKQNVQQSVMQNMVRNVATDEPEVRNPLFYWLFDVKQNGGLAEWKAVKTIIVFANSPVISTTCVFDAPQDVQQNVVQKWRI